MLCGQGDAGISFRPPANGTVPDGYVDGWIERLKPAMGNLSALGLLEKTYVCKSKVEPKHRDSISKLLPLTRRVSRADGFDEMPEIYNESVYEIFGGLKKQWPKLTTMAVLDWCAPPMRPSLGPARPNSCSGNIRV